MSNIPLGTTYNYHDPVLLNGILPYVDFLEVTPDLLFQNKDGEKRLRQDILSDLKEVQPKVKILAHGIGLSIGSYDGYSLEYIDLLNSLVEEIDLTWHSDHLGFTKVNGENINSMLMIPRSEEAIELLVPRIKALQDKYQIPFLLENIAQLIPNYKTNYSDAQFLNILTEETGCNLILDIYNLQCDAYNFNFDIDAFLKELNLLSVKEIHIAGGVIQDGFQLDIHTRSVAESTIELTQKVLDQENGAEVVMYEILPEAIEVFGQNMVIEELDKLSKIF